MWKQNKKFKTFILNYVKYITNSLVAQVKFFTILIMGFLFNFLSFAFEDFLSFDFFHFALLYFIPFCCVSFIFLLLFLFSLKISFQVKKLTCLCGYDSLTLRE